MLLLTNKNKINLDETKDKLKTTITEKCKQLVNISWYMVQKLILIN